MALKKPIKTLKLVIEKAKLAKNLKMNFHIIKLLNRLWKHIKVKRQKQFVLLLILMLFSSCAEVISIGSVIPFLGILASPNYISQHENLNAFILNFELFGFKNQLFIITVIFCFLSFFSGILRSLLLWASSRLSFMTGSDFGIDIYRRTLYQSYKVHCARNSSQVIDGILLKANGVIYSVIIPAITILTSGFILIAILTTLVFLDPYIALLIFCGFGFIYGAIILFARKKLLANGYQLANQSAQQMKLLQEGLGAIRDVLIDGTQNTYCEIYHSIDLKLRRIQASNSFIGGFPRYAIEALGIIFIASFAYSLSKDNDGISKAIPMLGALALGAQRLLPILQQAYSAWTNIQAYQNSLEEVLILLDQPISLNDKEKHQKIFFNKEIKLNKISFRYDKNKPYIFKDLTLKITKGSAVGFIGSTGNGKSTLLDIIMALLDPTRGSLEIDGNVINAKNRRAWQSQIAHVPQMIFLSDSSIAENIAFGIPKHLIDFKRVYHAAKQAQIADTIEKWPKGYQTEVGERGVRLSGGQRQRIGIARALYKKADIIIFDEATSALDEKTEQSVMEAIEKLSSRLTILIVAHRLSTLKKCTQIIEVNNGNIKKIGTYKNIRTLGI